MYKKTNNNGKGKEIEREIGRAKKESGGVKVTSAGLEMMNIYTYTLLLLLKPCIVCELDHRWVKVMNLVVFDVCFEW